VAANAERDPGFVTVCRAGDLAPGQARRVVIDGRMVGLFNVDGAYHAVDNVCLHRGGPLSEGHLSGAIVTCPWHGWQYDVTCGALSQDPRVAVDRHETRVVGDEIQVRLKL